MERRTVFDGGVDEREVGGARRGARQRRGGDGGDGRERQECGGEDCVERLAVTARHGAVGLGVG